MTKAEKRKGPVDIDRMAKEMKIPLSRIRKHLGIMPRTLQEARRAFSNRSADRAEALQAWVSLCATAADIHLLYQGTKHAEWAAIRDELVPKWMEWWKRDLEKTQTFEETYALAKSMPFFTSTTASIIVSSDEAKALQKLLLEKLLHYFETATQGSLICELSYEVRKDDAFVQKWISLCKTPDEIKEAYKACDGSVKELALKRIEICIDPHEVKKIYSKHGKTYERECILKMTQFFRK